MVNKKVIVLLSLLYLTFPPNMLVALDQGNERSEKQEIDNAKLVYLSPELQTALLALEKALVDHEWSLAFKRLCQDIEHEGDIAEYSSLMYVVNECLDSIALHECNAPLDSIRSDIEEYKTKLILGDLYVEPGDMNVDENHYKSSKFKRDLTVGFLAVNHALIVNGFEIVNGTLSVNGTLLVNGSSPGTGSVASVTGGTGITITGNPTVNPVVNLTVPVSIANGGTNATSMTNANGVVYYDGTLLNTTAVGTAGQILTSRGPGVSPIFVTGSGGSGIANIDGNSGAISGSTVIISGPIGSNITTSGSGTTMTVSVSGTTNHAVQIGNSTGSLSSVAVGATNTVLLGNTGADPSFGMVPNAALTNSSITLNSGTGISVTGSPVALGGSATITLSTPVSIANGGTNATSMTNTDGVVYYDGTKLNTTAVGTAGQVLTSNGTGNAPTFQTSATSIETINGNTGSISGSTVTIEGGNNITTSGSAATMTVNVSGTTNHAVQIGNSTGSLSSVAVGATNTVLLGNTSADPSFGTVPNAALTNSSITLTDGVGISVTGSPVALGGSAMISLAIPVTIADGGTNATSMTNANGVVYYDGTKLNTTTVGTAGQLLTSNGAGNAPTFQTLATSITTINGDSGSISGSTVTISGGNNIETSGDDIATMMVSVSGTTNHAVQIGNSTGSLSSVAVGATNTVLLGNTGADPSFGTVPNAALTNSSITLNSGTGISVTGSPVALGGSAMIALSTPVSVANGGTGASTLTSNGVLLGNGTSPITATTAGTGGQILIGSSGAPSFITPTAGAGLSITNNATTLSYALAVPVTIADGGTNATSMTNTDGVVYYDGTKLNTTTVGTAGQVLTSNGSGSAPTFQSAAASGITTINGDTGSISGSTVTIAGGNNITTSGNGGTIMTVSVSGTTNHAVQIGNSSGSLSPVAVGATNTVLLGNTGADPSFGTVPNAALTNSSITLNSGTGITVTGSPVSLGSSATIALSTPVSVANGGTGASTLTSNGVLLGNGTSPITATTAGTGGQVLIGSSGAPSFITPTAGAGLSITNNATTLSYALAVPVTIADGGTNATSMTNTDGVVYYDGTKLNTTTVGTAGQLLTSNGAGVAPSFQNALTRIATIDGNTGSVTGTTVTISGTGSSNINTTCSGTVMTVAVSGTTNDAVQIGNSSGSLTSIAVGATNTVLLGNTGAAPSFGTVPNAALSNSSITLTSGTGITVTGSPVSLGGSATIALTTPVSVANGGTGASTLTSNGVLLGNGTSPITATTAGTGGQVLIGSSGAPSFITPTAGAGLSITNNATTLSYALAVPVTIADGGTNATSMTNTDGVVYYDGTKLNTTTVGTAGQLLTSNGTGNAPTFQTFTITNDSGSVTGNSLSLKAGSGAGATVKFSGSGTAMTLSMTDANNNIAIGASAGNATMGSSNNVVGLGAGLALTTGSNGNCALGGEALVSLTTGTGNIAIGLFAGSNLSSSESNNIYLNHDGVAAESGKLRIGGTTAAFIAGISGVTVSGATVLVSAAGQLGVAASSARYKKNIKDIISSNVLDLRPVTFNYKDREWEDEIHYGLIAEEVADTIPDLVIYDNNKEPQTVKYHELPVLLLAQLKVLAHEIAVLKAERLNTDDEIRRLGVKIATLESKNTIVN